MAIIRTRNDAGIAMVTTLLVMMLVSALLVGFTAVVMSDQRYRFIDRDRSQAFYGAAAGLEKLTADLGNLFFTNVAPNASQVYALTTNKPTISGVQYLKADNSSGYTITSQNLGSMPISSGPYQGLNGLVTRYTMDVTARTGTNGEVHLQRITETVAIPVFQFAMFSDVDLAFFAGPNFDVAGRVHTNGNLFLAEGNGSTLTLDDKVTALKEVVRQRLENGVPITTSTHTGTVKVGSVAGGCPGGDATTCRVLDVSEGSVVDGPTSAINDPTWHNVSLSSYNGYIRNGRTGAKALNLPLITIGGSNTDLVRRPANNENTGNPVLYGERFYGRVSLRILLSDTSADLTSLPTVTGTPPVQLDGNWFVTPPNNGTAYTGNSGTTPNPTHPPIARTGAVASTTIAAGSAGASPNMTIRVVNINAFLPAMTLNGSAVPCTAKDAANNRFTGCTVGVAAANGAPLAAGPGISFPITNGPIATGAGKTVQVAAGNTAAFTPIMFWLGATPVSCTGWDATPQLTGCAGLTALPTNGQVVTTNVLSNAGTGTIGGFIKIEMQTGAGAWQDVTMEILNYGIGAPNQAGAICNPVAGNPDPTPNAIIRIQRLRDNGGVCTYATDTTGARDSSNWWPNVLFDTREALQRDAAPTNQANIVLGGVVHYIALDVGNLLKWFRRAAPYTAGSGTGALTNNGYSVYFSDRRNNRNTSNQETGEYGFEDFVNPTSDTGAPNNLLDAGEDVNGNGVLDTYGQFPNYNGIANSVPPGAAAPLDLTARPWSLLSAPQAQTNRVVLFRRALKLVNGGLPAIVAAGLVAPNTGLTLVSENPVYVTGDWNANQDPPLAADGHIATSVIADAVTLLTSGWNDTTDSFQQPYCPANTGTAPCTVGRIRPAQSYFRLAIIGGKGPAFPQPTAPAQGGPVNGWDFGTDGGAHNFLRYLESGGTVNYRGSIATFFYNRQAVGTYKCCATVYGAPARNYSFDVDFLDPTKLPPLTPVFRDLNTIGFTQETRAGR